MKDKNRLLWLDYAKLIGIYLVILGHLKLHYNISSWIYSFHMPLFFILAGYTDKASLLTFELLKKSIRILLIPYVSFFLISYAWKVFIVDQSKYISLADYMKPILGMIISDGNNNSFSNVVNISLWFLVALFICKIIFSYFITIFYNNIFLIVNIIAIFFVFILKILNLNLLFSLDSAIMAFPFYSFGYFLKKLMKRSENKEKYFFYNLFMSSLLILIGWFLSELNGRCDMRAVSYGNNIILFYINGIIGSLGIIYFSRTFKNSKNNFLIYLGSNTLIIFGVHLIITGVMKTIYKIIIVKLYHMDKIGFSLMECIIISFFVLITSIIPIYVIRKYFPFLIGK